MTQESNITQPSLLAVSVTWIFSTLQNLYRVFRIFSLETANCLPWHGWVNFRFQHCVLAISHTKQTRPEENLPESRLGKVCFSHWYQGKINLELILPHWQQNFSTVTCQPTSKVNPAARLSKVGRAANSADYEVSKASTPSRETEKESGTSLPLKIHESNPIMNWTKPLCTCGAWSHPVSVGNSCFPPKRCCTTGSLFWQNEKGLL